MRVPSTANLAAAIGYYRAFGAAPAIADGSAAPQDAGHFPQLERPAEVNGHILAWVTG